MMLDITFLGMSPATFFMLVAISTLFSSATAWRFHSNRVTNLNFGLAAVFIVFSIISIVGRGMTIDGRLIGADDPNTNAIGIFVFILSSVALFASIIAIYRKLKG